MTNFYKSGITEQVEYFPSVLTPARNKVGQVIAGYRMVREGESRIYPRGLSNQPIKRGLTVQGEAIGAYLGGTAGGLVDGVIHLVLDVAHIGLIVLGLMTLKKVL